MATSTYSNIYQQVTTSINYGREIFVNTGNSNEVANFCISGKSINPKSRTSGTPRRIQISHPRIRTLAMDGRTQNQEAII
jgi:hypothetical protein